MKKKENDGRPINFDFPKTISPILKKPSEKFEKFPEKSCF